MYRPSMYNMHDESMFRFAELFNECPVCKEVEMRPNEKETYDNDGVFVNVGTGIRIGFDWEYRDKYFANCKFRFSSLGQYERKISKNSIQLSIQCDSTQTGIAVAWHRDWLKEMQEKRSLATDYDTKEQGVIRYTSKFRIYSYQEVSSFKQMISRAMQTGVYSAEVFMPMKKRG